MIEFVTLFESWPRKDKTKELDVEKLCKTVYSMIRNSIDKLWINHECEEPGCKERFIVIQGSDKPQRKNFPDFP